MGRVDYRDELVARLPSRDPGAGATDAALALAVYRDAGIQGLQWLEGEFSLVVWDARRRCLVGIRDPSGAWPLFWCFRNSVLAMGSSLRSLADVHGGSPVDLDYLSDFLTRPFIPSELPGERTALPGSRRVLPGTLVEVSTDGWSRCHSWWDWASRIEPVGEQSPDDVADRFRELLDRAVRERMRRGRVAAHLSGGMDSSAVALLARRSIAGVQGSEPLVTISLVYEAPELAQERSYIDLVLAQGGAIEPHFIHADEAVGFDWFDQALPRHDEPYVGLWSLATNRLLADVARRSDVKTVLTGVGGDEILTYRPLHIADLLRRGRLLASLREASVWAEAQGQGVWSIMRKCGLEPILPSGVPRPAWAFVRRGAGNRPRRGRLSVPPWITPDFAREHQLHDRCRDYARSLFTPPAEFSETLNRLAMSSGDWARWYLHAPFGIDVSPSVPRPSRGLLRAGNPQVDPRGPWRAEARAASRNAGVASRCDPEPPAEDRLPSPHSRGLARYLPRLEELVHDARLRTLGLYDADILLQHMNRISLGIGSDFNEWIDRTLALIAWFEQHDCRPAV